jgi:hypothetical protein
MARPAQPEVDLQPTSVTAPWRRNPQPAIADATAHPEQHDAEIDNIAQLADDTDRPDPDAEPADAENTD